MKASHNFNLLDARGVISVTERQALLAACVRLPRLAPKRGWPIRCMEKSKMTDFL